MHTYMHLNMQAYKHGHAIREAESMQGLCPRPSLSFLVYPFSLSCCPCHCHVSVCTILYHCALDILAHVCLAYTPLCVRKADEGLSSPKGVSRGLLPRKSPAASVTSINGGSLPLFMPEELWPSRLTGCKGGKGAVRGDVACSGCHGDSVASSGG